MVQMQPPDIAGAHRAAPARRVLIIGGGASGVLLAAQLLRQRRPDVHVTLVERRELLGCGVAYSTSNASHLLNTRVSSMSAYPGEPDHFLDWLRENHDPEVERSGFVNRGVYGGYMASLLTPWRGGPRLTCVKADCLRLEEPEEGVIAHLSNGATIRADVAVLATGHALPEASPDGLLAQPWSNAPDGARDERILIVGSGLTMVDQVMSLLDADHRGEIVAVSRRGLLPQPHAPSTPEVIRTEELPFGRGAAGAMRWLRDRVADCERRGGDWRDVVDGVRPHMQALWRSLPGSARRSFLRHACVWWEVHRHRMPPASHARLRAAIASGRLRVMRGSFTGARRDAQGTLLAELSAGCAVDRFEMSVVRIVDCRGIRRDPEAHAGPLVADLLARGFARVDGMRIGLDVAADCAILRADGAASRRLYAVGPASRAAFWEITAIPDIREQVAELAARL